MNKGIISLNTAKKLIVYDKNLKKKLEYKKRIDKALEYIEEVYQRNEDGEDYIWIFDFGNIEKILKGDIDGSN